jgi:hypothetical protein
VPPPPLVVVQRRRAVDADVADEPVGRLLRPGPTSLTRCRDSPEMQNAGAAVVAIGISVWAQGSNAARNQIGPGDWPKI